MSRPFSMGISPLTRLFVSTIVAIESGRRAAGKFPQSEIKPSMPFDFHSDLVKGKVEQSPVREVPDFAEYRMGGLPEERKISRRHESAGAAAIRSIGEDISRVGDDLLQGRIGKGLSEIDSKVYLAGLSLACVCAAAATIESPPLFAVCVRAGYVSTAALMAKLFYDAGENH